jgi:hypothetical protein
MWLVLITTRKLRFPTLETGSAASERSFSLTTDNPSVIMALDNPSQRKPPRIIFVMCGRNSGWKTSVTFGFADE